MPDFFSHPPLLDQRLTVHILPGALNNYRNNYLKLIRYVSPFFSEIPLDPIIIQHVFGRYSSINHPIWTLHCTLLWPNYRYFPFFCKHDGVGGGSKNRLPWNCPSRLPWYQAGLCRKFYPLLCTTQKYLRHVEIDEVVLGEVQIPKIFILLQNYI